MNPNQASGKREQGPEIVMICEACGAGTNDIGEYRDVCGKCFAALAQPIQGDAEQISWLENLRDEARAICHGRTDVQWAEYRAKMADKLLAALRSPPGETRNELGQDERPVTPSQTVPCGSTVGQQPAPPSRPAGAEREQVTPSAGEPPVLDRWECPDCGYKDMPYPPKDYNICPKCMIEFGNDDRKTKLVEELSLLRASRSRDTDEVRRLREALDGLIKAGSEFRMSAVVLNLDTREVDLDRLTAMNKAWDDAIRALAATTPEGSAAPGDGRAK